MLIVDTSILIHHFAIPLLFAFFLVILGFILLGASAIARHLEDVGPKPIPKPQPQLPRSSLPSYNLPNKPAGSYGPAPPRDSRTVRQPPPVKTPTSPAPKPTSAYRGSFQTSQRQSSRTPGRFPAKSHPEPSDRRFPNSMLAEGRRLANNRCEHSDTRTENRCRNSWQEGDHFYDYGKGGATTLRNLVGACRWHNDPRSPTLKAKNPELERLRIEKRRSSYFPPGVDRSVGQWRNTGLRLTFAVKDKVHRISSPEPQELIEQAQEIIHYYAKPSAVTRRLDSLATFGELFDYIWSMRKHGLSVENLEGVDPLTGAWVSLRKPSQWAQDNPNGNGA